VDVTKPEEIAAAMLELATDQTKREKVAQAGYQHARKTFHISVVADAYLAVYEKILSELAP
jgi:glycosyltransferase involved in cell wall biosynthesis